MIDSNVESGSSVGQTTSNQPTPFEEAIALTGFGKFNKGLIVLGGVTLICVLWESLGINYILPILQCDLYLTPNQKGMISTATTLGLMLSSNLFGFLADTIGRRKIMLKTLICAFLCSAVSCLSTSFWFLFVFRTLTGVFLSAPSSTIFVYISEFHNIKYRPIAFSGVFVVFGLGVIAISLSSFAIINQELEFTLPFFLIVFKPWRLFLLYGGVPNLITFTGLLLFPESPKFVLLMGDQEKTIKILTKVYKRNGGKDKDLNIVSIVDEHCGEENMKSIRKQNPCSSTFKVLWNQTAPLFHKRLLRATFILCTLQILISVVFTGSYMLFPEITTIVAEYTKQHPGEQLAMCDLLTKHTVHVPENGNSTILVTECRTKLDVLTFKNSIVLQIIYTAGCAGTGFITNAFGNLPVLLFILTGCGISSFVPLYTSNPMIALYFFMVIVICVLVTPILNLATVELYPTNLKSMALSLALFSGRAGSVLGAELAAYLVVYKCTNMFIVFGVVLFTSALLTIFIPKITQQKPKKDLVEISHL